MYPSRKKAPKNPYYYLYYKFYRFFEWVGKRVPRNGDMFPVMAAVALAFLVVLNVIAIDVFASRVLPLPLGLPSEYILVVAGFMLLLNVFLFPYKHRYLQVVQRFKGESRRQRRLGAMLAVLYVGLSFYILVILSP